MTEIDEPTRADGPGAARAHWAWHLGALAVFVLGAVFTTREWFDPERMPGGDFPGYAAQMQSVRDALLHGGRIPQWCVECYGGATNFTSHLKERLGFPLALLFDPVLATQLLHVGLRIASALGLYACVLRWLGAPAVGIVAGYAYAFAVVPSAQSAHLDMALAAALMPPLFLATIEVFRSGRSSWALALGALVAAQFANNWVYAFVAPLAAGLVLWLRPWPGGRLAGRWLSASAVAGLCFALLAASQIAWYVADAPHHALADPQVAQAQRQIYVERSPFLFVNRANWLGPWLEEHQPPGFALSQLDGGRRYLGIVVLAFAAAALVAARAPATLALARVAGLLFLFQYWLALGPRTLWWEIASSFGISESTQQSVARVCALAAALCVLGAFERFPRLERNVVGRARRARQSGSLLAAALLLGFPAWSLWSTLEPLVPMFSEQRSPGHFFDTAPFWLCLLFAVGLAEVARRVSPDNAMRAALVALGVGLAIVWDFAPARESYRPEFERRGLASLAEVLGELEGEGGSQRIGLALRYAPRLSWLAAQSPAGHAWGWLHWQAGAHWPDAYRRALVGNAHSPRVPQRLKPDAAALARLRVRYLLLPPGSPALSAPWEALFTSGDARLWRLPRVAALFEVEGRPSVAPRAIRPSAERIRVTLEPPGTSSRLLWRESYHPWWRATVDGKEVVLQRAEDTFMAVDLGAASREVELRFRPPLGVRAADATSRIAGWGLAFAALFAAARSLSLRGRRPTSQTG